MPRAWVLVIGMHRSGTSAVTDLFHRFGLTLPADLMTGRSDNRSHFESLSLTSANDDILELLGGSWDDPPALAPGWEEGPDLSALLAMTTRVAATAFSRPGVGLWKDPRNSLLLPYWARALAPIVGVVLPWRDPIAVARSLHARDGIAVSEGVRLWQRYNVAALMNAAGRSVFVVNYDDMIDDPSSKAAEAAAWLRTVAGDAVVSDDGAIVAGAAITPALRHERNVGASVPDECLRVRDVLRSADGGHDSFTVDLDGFAAVGGR